MDNYYSEDSLSPSPSLFDLPKGKTASTYNQAVQIIKQYAPNEASEPEVNEAANTLIHFCQLLVQIKQRQLLH